MPLVPSSHQHRRERVVVGVGVVGEDAGSATTVRACPRWWSRRRRGLGRGVEHLCASKSRCRSRRRRSPGRCWDRRRAEARRAGRWSYRRLCPGLWRGCPPAGRGSRWDRRCLRGIRAWDRPRRLVACLVESGGGVAVADEVVAFGDEGVGVAVRKSTSVLVLAETMVESTSVRVAVVPVARHPASRSARGGVVGYGGVLY